MGKEIKKNAKPCTFRYSRKFKEQVCSEFLKGGITKADIERKYQVGHGRVLYWLQECGYLAKDGSLTPKRILMGKNKPDSSDTLSSAARIKQLEKALEQANLQAEAYRLMIEIAERELKIDIKKK